MADYAEFSRSGLKIEVDGGPPGSTRRVSQSLLPTIRELTEALAAELEKLSAERTPDSIEIVFGLKTLSDGEMAISLGQDQANFRVSLTWGSGQSDMQQNLPFDLSNRRS